MNDPRLACRMKAVCKHCGGPIEIRNPRGDCDHLYWPDMLTDEAKRANGYRKVLVEQWRTESEIAADDFQKNGKDRW